jgi:hypothetical protein
MELFAELGPVLMINRDGREASGVASRSRETGDEPRTNRIPD